MYTIRVVIDHFLDEKNKSLSVGGVQNYCVSLAQIAEELGYRYVIYQPSKDSFSLTFDNITVTGVKKSSCIDNATAIVRHIEKKENPNLHYDILLFATDFLIRRNDFVNTVAIQHGVAWDIVYSNTNSFCRNITSFFKGALRSTVKYSRFRHCRNIVCVDYNFLNWYRTQVYSLPNNFFIIPNFTEITPYEEIKRKYNTEKRSVDIIFARRFERYRGTRLFIAVIDELLAKYPQIRVTFAGAGPDETLIKEKYSINPRVALTRYSPSESLAVHKKHDIAVVPTIGSEGTSLSLLEGMSAGCACVATNVGGMTNIIIDGYNGRLVNPNKEDLVEAISKLIDNPVERIEMAKKGYEVVSSSFSFDLWKRRWKTVIEKHLQCKSKLPTDH